jgi:uncharacterized membrane protein YgcG
MAMAAATITFSWCYGWGKAIFMIVSSKITLAYVLSCAGIASLGTAIAASETPGAEANPYSVISDRNIFHLSPEPPPKDPDADKPPVELPKVALTGFIGKGDSIRVLLAIPPAKDSKDGLFSYLSLAPGDRDQGVQLVKIHKDKESVDIMNSGTLQTLTKSNSLASLGSSPRPAGVTEKERPGGIHRPAIPGYNPPTVPVVPTAANQGGGGGSSVVIGGRDSGSSSGGTIVSGGSSSGGPQLAGGASAYGGGGGAYVGGGVPTGAVNSGNNVGNQIANGLFNPSAPRYQTQIPATIVPPEMQGPIMATKKLASQAAAGTSGESSQPEFPPLPPAVQQELDGAMGGQPQP